jgi:uroporphyrinogen-III decarboxylase
MDKKWAELSPDEKREERFKRWLEPPDVAFSSPEAERAYKERVTRFIKVIKLEEPDRVPVTLPAGFLPAYYAGGTLKTAMYDYDELKRAWLKFLNDFEMDVFAGPGFVLPGKMLDMIDYKFHLWPGHGLADHLPSYQFIEGEYMTPEEYDDFIRDPADFLLRTYLPRSAGALAGLSRLGPLTPFIGIPVFYITQFGDPEIRAAVQALLDAGQEGAKWQAAVAEVGRAAQEAGVPSLSGGLCGAPFDLMSDMMRGTKGIMLDMYRRPDKLLEAMEVMTPILVNEAVGMANASGGPVIFMPLHKGTGGFMSNEQFETFYWPTLKKVMLGLIDEGLVPLPFAEGDYEPRLEIIKDMPRGKVIWYFEEMDMARAKEVLGDNACIAGNLPVSTLCTGTPQQVKEGCRRLIETCAPGGGYILTASASMNQGNPENLRAMMEAAKEYGVYG